MVLTPLVWSALARRALPRCCCGSIYPDEAPDAVILFPSLVLNVLVCNGHPSSTNPNHQMNPYLPALLLLLLVLSTKTPQTQSTVWPLTDEA